MMEVCLGLLLAAFGFFCGRKTAGHGSDKAAQPAPEEQELRRLQEDRAAFAALMGYNVQTAYGDSDTE